MRHLPFLSALVFALISGCSTTQTPTKSKIEFAGWSQSSLNIAKTSKIYGTAPDSYLNFIAKINMEDAKSPCGDIELVAVSQPEFSPGTSTPMHRSGSEPREGAELEDWVLQACGARQVWRAWANPTNNRAGFERLRNA